MTLYQGSRKYTSSLQEVEVPVEVAPTSTAQLGKHFEFVDGKSVLTTAKSSSVAKAKIRLLKREAGHDKIVLRLADSRYFNAGAQNRATITLAGPTDLKLLAGTWHCKGLSNEAAIRDRSEEHTSELQSRQYLVCRLLLEKKKQYTSIYL